ncbi:late competence development ComFB family protein [Bacillus sp. UMB0893]|uniref:late competence development ComFB family protein n=1 Tax=Bacillus sp. UMB0893 TaxID=2066053 RepID=UPI000C78645F|nr:MULTISPECIES: late competence development ComFB family protein [Bacillaceae]PLR67971.1 competence protein ComFB [Bacillus sp. UMB0893]QNG60248.1 late competence development ComFB family protein [Bacillus sp. PAMC26568]
MVVNAMERIMIDLLDEYKSALQMNCTCDECLNDVLALVLNRIQPRYVTNPDKVAYVKAEFVDKQQMTTLIVKLAECAKIVSDVPRCENYVRGES